MRCFMIKWCLMTNDVRALEWEEWNEYMMTRSRPRLNFSEATCLFQTNLSQLGTICLQTRNTKYITVIGYCSTVNGQQHQKNVTMVSFLSSPLQLFTKPGGNRNRWKPAYPNQQTWPLWAAAFWWWQAIRPAVHFVAKIQKPSPSCASDPTQHGLPFITG